MKHCKDYMEVDWSEIVRYDENSPTKLVSTLTNLPVGRKSSQRAVDENRIGWILSYKSGRWLVHRIIACLELGGISTDEVVDHYDGNPYNNLLSNLRVTDQSTNLKNKCKQSNNTSGINGVGVYYTKIGNPYVLATYKSHGKAKCKTFKILSSIEDSLIEGTNWLHKLQQQDGLFTERHGK